MEKFLEKGSPPVPLYYQLKEDIKGKISGGRYPRGSAIPGEFQLMDSYGVSRTTVLRAVSELVNEGLLSRVHGKGTFVSSPKPRFHAHQMVGLAMRTHGHLYGALSRGLISNLQEHEYFCTTVEWAEEGGDYSKLELLLRKTPGFLIVDGHHLFPYEILKNYSGNLIFVLRYRGREEYSGNYILSDYYKGGVLIAEKFISLGFRRAVFLINPLMGRNKSVKDCLRGAADVFRARGLPEEGLTVFPHGDDEEKIRGMMVDESKPAAVWCESDFIAKSVYSIARELGFRIPEDISVIGYYNTPWCEVFHPGLTSVSVREDEIAEIVGDKITGGSDGDAKILIEPRLIERQSTRRAAGG